MKFSCALLPVLLLGLSGCVTSGDSSPPLRETLQSGREAGTLVIKPITFKEEAAIRQAVRRECSLDGKLTTFIERYAAEQYGQILNDTASAPVGAQILTIEIDQVRGEGGGAWSGPKEVVITGHVSQDGKLLGDFRGRRYSGGGMFGAYKGTCAILARCVKALGSDVAKWLQHPAPKAVLGDL